ncbi:MAG: CBS domain-containing protein [Lentilitoribacter sp.]
MSPTSQERLENIATSLKNDGDKSNIKTTTTRNLLSMFNQKRRGSYVIGKIRNELANAGLNTNPDFENVYIDEEIEFFLINKQNGSIKTAKFKEMNPRDVVVRLKIFRSANKVPVSVSPDTDLSTAISVMIANDYSQLPVMTTKTSVKGIITWETIGIGVGLGKTEKKVSDYMKDAHILSLDTALIDAIPEIIQREHVLVRDEKNTICGIVTDNDLSMQFNVLTAPFLLLNEIETQMREFLSSRCHVTDADVIALFSQAGNGMEKANSLNDLTFSQYHLLISEQNIWNRAMLKMCNGVFREQLDQVRMHRNDVMHFNADEADQDMLQDLRNFAKLLEVLIAAPAVE